MPDDEAQRVAALHETRVLDTERDRDFDDIALLAMEVCGTPIGLVSLVDSDRQWCKAKVGFELDGTSRDMSFCTHAVADRQLMEVGDTTADPRFADNPLVTGHGVRFYAGAPLMLQGGHVIGTVCVLDREPGQLSAPQRRALRALARHAAALLDLRRYASTAAQSTQRLRELDRLMESFLSNVSHELRTPLTTIRGYLEMMLDAEYDPVSARRFLSTMQRNADRLLRLIDDLLQVARLREQDIDLNRVEIDLADLAFQLVAGSRPLAEHKNITLVEETERPVTALGDPQRLSQALSHLLLNAIKFTPAGGRVTVATRAANGPCVMITDSGTGVAEADLPYLFDAFYRSPSADAEAVPGVGVGLTLVKSIVDAHHGTITAEQAPGGGICIRITLPAAGAVVT
ncbi:GAF domain-containing sensor histidine kinase [Actinoplanes sp. DH11]|uniref:GAF domain-containing sensor histidine kinase n=1 Tax=Actinoplanes sp. DH11 TaxID=2857011 RepID=UPI001E5B8618|nr:GAF domain-containing sensor histidine kinase [Actinoplanes sp. DH11]